MTSIASHIQHTLDVLGCTQDELAKRLGLSAPSNISQWITGRRPLPAAHCRKIEKLTGGQVTRYQLRPDIFGQGPDELNAA